MNGRRTTGFAAVAGFAGVAALLAGCGVASAPADRSQGHPTPAARKATSPASSTSTTPTVRPVEVSDDPYVRLARALHRRGVEVWFEADLVARWLEGPAAFDTAVARLGALAKVPGTRGFKIADEIGYDDGLDTPGQVEAFLRAARAALGRAAPGKLLLVDAVVPDLGCLPWRDLRGRQCAAAARRTYPAATQADISAYLSAGLVDRLDLSTGLLDDASYAARGLTRDQAQVAAWRRVHRLGWPRLAQLQARKALAAPGGYQGSAAEATADVRTFVDIPVAAGAAAVDVWTWRQPYDGRTVSLLPDSLRQNPLWAALTAERADGVHLITHMTPSAMPAARAAFDHECDVAAAVFDAVFVAAGTG